MIKTWTCPTKICRYT